MSYAKRKSAYDDANCGSLNYVMDAQPSMTKKQTRPKGGRTSREVNAHYPLLDFLQLIDEMKEMHILIPVFSTEPRTEEGLETVKWLPTPKAKRTLRLLAPVLRTTDARSKYWFDYGDPNVLIDFCAAMRKEIARLRKKRAEILELSIAEKRKALDTLDMLE